MKLIGPDLQRAADCDSILRSLPRWFGIEEALVKYVRDTATMPTFAIEQGQTLSGFITLQKHFQHSWEVHCMAVASSSRGQGLGRKLLLHAEEWVREQGGRFLQIKTVAESSPSPEYAETRKFYAAMNYTPVEVFPTLWHPRNPALQLIKVLSAT